MDKSNPGIDKFFALAQERYRIHLLRLEGKLRPWSADPIFQREYFCNVFREDDKTTKWFRENIRSKIKDPRKLLLAIVAFRWFNKIESGEKIKLLLLGEWNSLIARTKLEKQSPVVTGAYIIKTPDGLNKLDGVLWCIDRFQLLTDELGISYYFQKLYDGHMSMQKACELLKQSPYLGNFMAWQICSDLRQTSLLENAPDKDVWAQPGPGTARGLGRTFYNDPNHFKYGSDQTEMLTLMNDLSKCSKDVRYWPAGWPPMAVIDIAHWACEVDKYYRAEEGGRMKRKYRA